MDAREQASQNPVLNELVRGVKSVLTSGTDPEDVPSAVAAVVRPFLRQPGLLEARHREPDLSRYRQHILHVDEGGAFSIASLVWLPGQGTAIHDHVSWCVVGVMQGREREESYRLIHEGQDRYLLPLGHSTSSPGAVSALHPPGDIHRVYNPGPEVAVSLHVYGADVSQRGTSIREIYDLPIVEVLPLSHRVGA